MNERLPIGYPLALAWTLALAAVLQALLLASVAHRPSAATDLVHLGGVEALVFVTGVFGVVSLHARDLPLKASLGIRACHPGFLLLGLCLGFSLHWPAESVEALVQRFLPTPPEEMARRIALLSAPSTGKLVLVLLVVACVAPLVEELFFRGALFGALRRGHSLFGAAAVTSLCFVISHLDYYLWAPLTVVAAVMTHLRAVSGSLLPSLATHVGFNAVSVLALFSGASPAAEAPRFDPVSAAAGSGVTCLLVGAVQYLASRSPEARRGRAEDVE